MTILIFFTCPLSVWAQHQQIAPKNSSPEFIAQLSDSAWVRLVDIDKSLVLDIRYATANNFTKKAIYPCADAILRKDAAMALKKAGQVFQSKGLLIKVFDAYRPPSAQWVLWYSTPNKLYVSDPRKGSKHSMGIALDITLVDKYGQELDMGTPYDSFSPMSHHSCEELPTHVLKNRQILKSVMESVGFVAIKSEWWHYNFLRNYGQAEIAFDCGQ